MDAPNSPFRLTQFVWESHPGRYVLSVVVHGTARLSQGQEASFIPNAEYPVGHDESQAMIARLNVVAPFKPRADVCVVGKAYAPPGTDIDRIVARVRVGDFSKALSITGDRLWIRDGARWGSSPPRPFSQMLLAPERAIRSAENPVGLDPAAIPMEGRLAMPNLEPVSGSYSAVIGPVPPNAPSRRNLLSGAAVGWVTTLEMGRAPGPPPEGMNFQFFNVAPLDQQLPELAPGSAIVLENLHPAHAIFTSRMPPLVPRVTGFDPATRRTLEISLRLDTLWIDGDREIAWVVYRGTVDIARPDLPVSLHVEAERWQRPADAPPPSMGTATMLQTHTGANAPAPLPFGGARPAHGYGGWGNANPNEQTGGYYAQQSAGRTIQNETTSRLEETGSYPPPPPPKRSITQEIEIPAAPRPVGPAGLPFGGSGDANATWDPETTTSTGLPRQDTTELHAPTTADLPRQETAVLSAIVDPPTRHRTEPPPPPNASSALPFGGNAPPRPSELSPVSRTQVGATSQAPAPRRLVPRGAPGPIPDIGPTQEPTIDVAWLVDEVSEVTHADEVAEAASVAQAPLIVPRSAPAPVAPPAPAPIAPPPVAPPPPAPIVPPPVAPPVEVAPPSVAPPPPVEVAAPPPVAPPPVAPPPVAPPALPKPPTAVPSAVSVLPAVPSAVSVPTAVPSAVAPSAPPPSADSASDTEPPPPIAAVGSLSAVAPSAVAPPPPAVPSAVSVPPAVPSAVSLPVVPSAVTTPPVVPSAVSVPTAVPSAVPPTAVAPPTVSRVSAPTTPPPASAPSSDVAVDAAPQDPIAAQPSAPPPAAPPSAAPSYEPVAPPLLSPIAPPKLATLIPPATKSVPPPSVRAATPSAPPPAAPAFADDDTPPAPERAEHATADTAPPVEPPKPERSELGFEESARLRGELSIKGADKAAVLAKYNVSDAVFAKSEREHLTALDENARAGKSDLLERYDDAYLDAQDAARGPVDELAYAKIQFARERGQLPQVLDELHVQRNDLMRLDRVWRRRLAADKELAEKVEDELERLRTEG